MNIHFEKATEKHQKIIFSWLNDPHMTEFCDNAQEHKDDILNFIQGKKQHYFYGLTECRVGYVDNDSYCFVLSDIFKTSQELKTKEHSEPNSLIIFSFDSNALYEY